MTNPGFVDSTPCERAGEGAVRQSASSYLEVKRSPDRSVGSCAQGGSIANVDTGWPGAGVSRGSVSFRVVFSARRARLGPREGLSPPPDLWSDVILFTPPHAGREDEREEMTMTSNFLPERPDLDQLRRRAKELLDAARSAVPAALERMHRYPRSETRLTLSAAQWVIAREHGFPSWPQLKAEVEARAMSLAQRADAFLEASVEGRMGRAGQLLTADPLLAGHDIRTAAVLGDAWHVRRLIARDPVLALNPDDRRGWPALLYVCHSRWHRVDSNRTEGMLEVARLLLDAGASPNTNNGLQPRHGYRSALYGAAGIANNPAITRLLLERGADPNDDESLYHAAYHEDHACLRLLVEHGATVEGTNALAAAIRPGNIEGVRILLGAGGGAGWPVAAASAPTGRLADRSWGQLPAAVECAAGAEVVQLLLAAGADPNAPCPDGRSVFRSAVRRGTADVAELLLSHGARDDASQLDRLLGACMRAERAEAERLLAGDPDLLEQLIMEDPAALANAIPYAGRDAIRLLLDLGFPVNSREARGGSALHEAAYFGRADIVRLLLERGADVDAHDGEWNSTPLAFATVGSGERVRQEGDWITTAQTLLDAGASKEGCWVQGKPPNEGVADLLHAYGIVADGDVA